MAKEQYMKLDFDKIVGDRFGRYSKYVIQERALPDARDGLKPVQRRILYAMNEEGNTHEKAYRKSAKAVGTVIGNYHPHGDSSVYEALARMAQDWKVRYPLTDMHGNKGSIDGDSPAAMRYCVTGDTLVNTDRGLVRIDEIVENSELNSEEDIDIEVQSIEGTNKASKFFNSGVHETFEVTLDKGYKIEGTENHPLLVVDKSVEGKPVYQWKTIDEIIEGDLVVTNFNEDQIESNNDLVSEDLAAFLGIMVSEGWISGEDQKYYRVGLNMKDVEIVNDMKRIMEEEFGVNVREDVSGNTKVVHVDNKEFHNEFVERFNYGINSYSKRVPDVILKSSKNIQRVFLKYLFEGDGSSYFNNEGLSDLSYTSYSKELISQLQVMLASFGIMTARHKDGKGERVKLLGYESLHNFRKNIGFVSERKIKRLDDAFERYSDIGISKTNFVPFISDYLRSKYSNSWLNSNNFDRKNKFYKNKEVLKDILSEEDYRLLEDMVNNGFVYLPVKSIESKGENTVYSIRVDSECHSFTANGIINHNTEARLSKEASMMLKDIKKETVDMVDNFDDTTKEPAVLPAGYPNLLVNGSSGIASGYATSVPPHNMSEVIEATVKRLDSPNSRLDTLLSIVQGPDFPGGGEIQGKEGLKEAYETGKGKVVLRAKFDVEKKKGRRAIVVSEIPYDTNKSKIVESIDLIRMEKKVEGIASVVDESDKHGIRIVIELKKGADKDNILAYLFKNTDLQVNVNFNMVAIKDGTPETLGLEGLLDAFIEHRKDVVIRRSKFDLEKAENRHHIVEGIIKAMSILNKVIKTIRESKNKSDAINELQRKYSFSEKQATAIVNLQLYRLSNTDVTALENELKELEEEIKYLKTILNSEKELIKVVKKELNQVKKDFGDERRTEIVEEAEEMNLDMTAVVPEEGVMLSVSKEGYLKRSSYRSYSSSGGEEAVGIGKGDSIVDIHEGKTTQTLLVFTSNGNYVYLPVHEMNDDKWKDVGTHISHYAPLDGEEYIVRSILVDDIEADKTVFIVKDSGLIKRSALKDHKVQRNGKAMVAIKCAEDENVVDVYLTEGNGQVVIVSENGYGIHFEESEVMPKGIKTNGMRGIHLDEDDKVKRVDIVRFKKDVKEVEDEVGGKIPQKPKGRKGGKIK